MAIGYAGLIIGAIFAGLVYVVIAIIVKNVGVKWIDKLMPAVVIGPTVAIIGLSLAGNAVGDIVKGLVTTEVIETVAQLNAAGEYELAEAVSNVPVASPLIAFLCGIVTLFTTMLCSTYGKKMAKLIPFIIGIMAGYVLAVIFTVIGNAANIPALQVISFTPFTALVENGVSLSTFLSVPDLTFLTASKGLSEINGSYIATVAVAYIPVAFVVFAEHIADHKNISSIIERDLLTKPGLHRTLLGDGIGSMFGAFFGGCPNTTYGESIACVAITRNASVASIIAAAIGAIIISFVSPFIALVNSIPPCVMGGVCMALYGFIAVSGLKMFKNLDLDENRNLFVVSAILIAGIGGLTLTFGKVTITAIACALILGIVCIIIGNGIAFCILKCSLFILRKIAVMYLSRIQSELCFKLRIFGHIHKLTIALLKHFGIDTLFAVSRSVLFNLINKEQRKHLDAFFGISEFLVKMCLNGSSDLCFFDYILVYAADCLAKLYKLGI